MSLHAALDPKALRLLHTQKRNTTLSSMFISILSIALLGLSLALFLLPAIETDGNFTQCIPYQETVKPKPPKATIPRFFTHLPPAGANTGKASIIAETTNPLHLPQLEFTPQISGLSAGEDLNNGHKGFNPDNGGFKGLDIIANDQRCSKQDRLSRLRAGGGNLQTEDAVIKALHWLKKTQSPDGSWGDKHKVAMTGLALLSYLGHCEDPSSEEFGESCLQGIVYLIDTGSKKNGKLATDLKDRHWPYEHAIATYALAEAYSFSKRSHYQIPQHQEILQLAGEWIISHQHPSGGWDYAYDTQGSRGGDLSIAAWHIQALKACHVTGLDFKGIKKTAYAALDYVGKRQAKNGGFGYTGTTPVGSAGHHSLTGAGILAYQMWGKGSRSEVRKGARYILAEAKLDYNGADCDLYAHYYHSQAMMQRGGDQWTQYNQMFSDQILLNQGNNGAWKKPGGGKKINAAGAMYANNTPEGIHYRTCLCTLMLEVYYRYLPATH